jgi:hypothetical protein
MEAKSNWLDRLRAIRNLVKEIMPVAFFAATFTTEFLGYPDEAETAVIMFSEYFDRLASGQL